MPAWLITFLLNTALKLGLAWLVKRFPGIPEEVKSALQEFINEVKVHKTSNKIAKKKAAAKIKACYGVGCPTDLKGE